MPVSRTRKPKKRNPSRKPTKERSRIAKGIRWAWGAAIVLATFSSIYALMPHLSVFPSSTLRVDDPLGTVFILTNNGMLSVRDVKLACWINMVTFDDNKVGNGGLTGQGIDADRLERGHTLAVPCFRYLPFKGFKSISADLAIKVEYRVPFLPSVFPRWQESFAYKTDRDDAGKCV